MLGKVIQLHGRRMFECAMDGTPLGSDNDAVELLSAAWGEGADFLLIPVTRLDNAFFDLKTGVAGNFVQKLVNYGSRCAIVGKIALHLERSRALRDFVMECNRGRQIWFVEDHEGLAGRLGQEQSELSHGPMNLSEEG
jgi:hypothetical protein